MLSVTTHNEKEVDNLELATFIAKVCQKPLIYEMVNHHADRPGHDLRYGLSGAKMAKMGWVPPYGFEASLTKSIKWTLQNRHWLELKRRSKHLRRNCSGGYREGV